MFYRQHLQSIFINPHEFNILFHCLGQQTHRFSPSWICVIFSSFSISRINRTKITRTPVLSSRYSSRRASLSDQWNKRSSWNNFSCPPSPYILRKETSDHVEEGLQFLSIMLYHKNFWNRQDRGRTLPTHGSVSRCTLRRHYLCTNHPDFHVEIASGTDLFSAPPLNWTLGKHDSHNSISGLEPRAYTQSWAEWFHRESMDIFHFEFPWCSRCARLISNPQSSKNQISFRNTHTYHKS